MPASFDGFSDRLCSFAILTDTDWNSCSHDEQQSSRPHGPTPPVTFVSSRAPICFVSTRVWSAVARSRPSARRSAFSSAATKTTVREPSSALSIFTSFTVCGCARITSTGRVALLALALEVLVLAREVTARRPS
jgi:hypothetical protein